MVEGRDEMEVTGADRHEGERKTKLKRREGKITVKKKKEKTGEGKVRGGKGEDD